MLAWRVSFVAALPERTLRLACLAVIGLGLLLSTVFRRSRLFFAFLLLFLTWFSVDRLVPTLPTPGIAQAVINATAALLALNMGGLALLRDRGVISPPGLRRLMLVAIQICVVVAIALPSQARAAALLQRSFVEPRFTQWSRIAQPVMVVFAAAALLLLVRLLWKRRPVDNGLFWALTTIFFGFNTRAQAFGIYVTAAGLILCLAVLETSHIMAYRDELTDLPGRRALNESLLKLGSSYAVGMVDVDHFKRFNDEYGHDAGDQVLRKVASKLASVGGNGKPYRYGGEEFAVIFTGKSVEEAYVHLDRVRKDIEEAGFGIRGRDRRKRRRKKGGAQTEVTVSIGIAGNARGKVEAKEVVQAADKALYRAKQCGRNCTIAGEVAC